MTIRWYGLVAPEDVPTGDRRMIAAQALDYRAFPLPAMWQRAAVGGHDAAVVVASWDRWYASEGGIWAEGTFLDPAIVPEVVEAIYLLGKKLIGPSVDLDPDLAYEVVPHPVIADEYAIKITKARCRGVTFVMAPAFPQVHVTVEDDEEYALLASAGINMDMVSQAFVVNKSAWRSWPVAERETAFGFQDAVNRIAEWSGGNAAKFGSAFLYRDKALPPNNRESYKLPIADIVNGKITLIPRAVMSAATILSGAHGGLPEVPDSEKLDLQRVVTEIYDTLNESYGDPRFKPPWQRGGRDGATSSDDTPTTASVEDAVTAALDIPVAPDRSVFANPKLRKRTKLKVDGHRVYGHLASWKQCHMGIGNRCVMAPKSITNYKLAKTGEVLCSDGTLIEAGKITLGTGHADERYGVIPARDHYDNTGTCVARVVYGEDAHGVWFAGTLVPGTTEETAALLRLSPLSGDWRKHNGNLELVAALAVNDPGFPILTEDEEGAFSLVAAGMIIEDEEDEPPTERDFGIFSSVDEFLESQARAERRRLFEATALEEECNCVRVQ
jgi:hypothetical protein